MGRLLRIVPALVIVTLACSPERRSGTDSAAPSGESPGSADSAAPLSPPAATASIPPAAVPPPGGQPVGSGKFGPRDGLHIDPARPPDSSRTRPPLLSTQPSSSLESQARALARTTGCERASQCRTAPLGAKACGGPRGYLVYCPLSTDTAALYRKLGELERAEKEYNRRNQMASTCQFLTPPAAGIVSGRCASAQSPP